MAITLMWLIFPSSNINKNIISSQADEPIADYAAMDDVYQGKYFHRHLFDHVISY